MTTKAPPLRADAYGPPDAFRGFQVLGAWIERNPLALALRHFTSDADIRAALQAYPQILDHLEERPGPYSQYLAERAAALARKAMDDIA